jgi:hypothetical protein
MQKYPLSVKDGISLALTQLKGLGHFISSLSSSAEIAVLGKIQKKQNQQVQKPCKLKTELNLSVTYIPYFFKSVTI